MQAGRLRPLAVTTARRSPLLPEVPTVAETIPGFEIALWNGLLAPAGTPPAAIARLARRGRRRRCAATEMRAEAGRAGQRAGAAARPRNSPRFIRAEIPRWTEIVRVSGATAE